MKNRKKCIEKKPKGERPGWEWQRNDDTGGGAMILNLGEGWVYQPLASAPPARGAATR